MEPVVIALASNEPYFPGLCCAVVSALSHLDSTREVDFKVLDGGLSPESRSALSRLIEKFGECRLEVVTVDPSVFSKATLGPGKSHMTYCRTLLPQVLNVPRLIYLDCDVLVFRDLAKLFDLELPPGKVLAAVPDSETPTLEDDSRAIAAAMGLPADGHYFNAGVVLLNLDELRKQNFTKRSLEFFRDWKGHYRFWDQSAINFLLHGRIAELHEHWNRAACRFDEQDDNDLDCVLHYTRSVPWLGGMPGPAQVLFERFAADAGAPVNRQIAPFKQGQKEKCAGYRKAAWYWFYYILNAPRRRRLHHRRAREIQGMRFKLSACRSAT
ncbi:MAG: hypothetical protein DME90_03685 [Verrucomicrobia bacterium]|nr:MAG: hypothetical protein DME90_03685 [Verrucomicrobiota bacterium]